MVMASALALGGSEICGRPHTLITERNLGVTWRSSYMEIELHGDRVRLKGKAKDPRTG